MASRACLRAPHRQAATGSFEIGSLYKALLYAGCMSAMFVAAAAYAVEAEAPSVAVQGDTEIYFGAYPANLRKEASFTILNTGLGVLKIGRIRKTCGCAEVQIDRTEIPPGEHATLKAVILEHSIYGAYRKNVYVESNDPAQRFLSLTLSGNAIPLVSVKPSDAFYAGILESGIEWRQEFLLEASVEGVLLSDPEVRSDVENSVAIEKKNPKAFRLQISITPSGENDAFSCKISIPITKPEGWKPLEINIKGRVRK